MTFVRSRFISLLLVAIAGTLLGSCASQKASITPEVIAPSVLLPAARGGIADGRARFREIFREVLSARSAKLPTGEPYGDTAVLWKLADEPPGTGRPVSLGATSSDFRVVIVPGLLAECVSDISLAFGDARKQLEDIGYKIDYIQTRGRGGSARNADLIRDAVAAMPAEEKLIFVTHSKGAVDTLEALVKYPSIAERTAAVIAFSGAVNGSPLADLFPEFLVKFAHEIPLSSCAPGEGAEAMESLRRNVRISWLSTHQLPENVRYYSLPAFATRENTSRMLRPFYDVLANTDQANDGQVLCSDGIIPGSTLLGYPNADHLAVAMPFNKQKYPMFAALADKNDYPRAALLEAALRFVEEDLRNDSGRSSISSGREELFF
jgi:hypothetical protein